MNAELATLAARAVDRGCLVPADMALLPGMAAADEDAMRALLELAGPEPQDCARCAFRRRPGHVDYCAHPDAVAPRVYALLSQLPADHGQTCERFEPSHGGRS
jgi:hypothetical protein